MLFTGNPKPYPQNDPLDREWLHIHIINGGLYVFTDDGHWENSQDPESRADWVEGIETSFKALEKECFIDNVDNHGYPKNLRVRIRMKPKIITLWQRTYVID